MIAVASKKETGSTSGYPFRNVKTGLSSCQGDVKAFPGVASGQASAETVQVLPVGFRRLGHFLGKQ